MVVSASDERWAVLLEVDDVDGPALKAVPKEKLQMVNLGEEAKVVGGEGCETGETLQVKINGETMIEIEDGRLFKG